MRILAIRGRNLASLAGDFEVDFTRGPLAAAGLFAISGATGAGKSTLLDALCLALYEDTPRLARASARGVDLPDVGEDTVAPRDPRNLLRRGCAEGWAEADFLGNDGLAYRARWAVRRARGRIDGKLQAAEMALARIDDGRPVAGPLKTEVKAAIVERIGLGFEQFTRAVLLAQNEFFAFLRATDDDRATLLQTLTGTDRFEDISRRAFERNKLEQEQLARLEQQLADHKPLDAQARSGAEVARTAARAEVQTLEVRVSSLEAQLRWHQSADKARQAEAAAAAALRQAEVEHAAAAQRRRDLELVDAMEPARPLLAEADRLDRERAEALAQATASDTRLALTAQRARDAASARAATAETLRQAQHRRGDLSPAVEEAKRLDTEIAALAPGHTATRKACAEAEAALAKARAELEAEQARHAALTRELKSTEAWLVDYGSLKPLAEGWLRWDRLFADAAAALAELHRIEAELGRLDKAQADAQAASDSARTALQQAEARHGSAQANSSRAEAVWRSFDADTLATLARNVERQRDQLLQARTLWRELFDRQQRTSALGETLERLGTESESLRLRMEQLAAAKPAALAAEQQAQRAWRIAHEACGESVEALRAALTPATPCPVCGATDHPYAQLDARLRSALGQLEVELDRCREARALLEREESACAARREADDRTILERRQELEALLRGSAELQQQWERHALAPQLAAQDEDARDAWLADRMATTDAELRLVADQQAAQRQASAAREEALQALEQARRGLVAAAEAGNIATRARDLAAQQLVTARASHAAAETRLAGLLQDLGPARPMDAAGDGWHLQWRADPSTYHAARSQEAAEWRKCADQAEQLRARDATFATRVEALAAAHRGAQDAAQGAAASLRDANQRLAARQAQRQALFEGSPFADRSVVDIEAQLAAGVEAARKELEAGDAQAREAERLLARDTEARNQAHRLAANLDQTASQATQALAAWLGTYNTGRPAGDATVDAIALRRLLAHDTAWTAAERQALQALDVAVREKGVILAERRTQRAALGAERAGTDDAGTVAEALAGTRQALEQGRGRLGEAELELRRDDERHARSADLLRALEIQREVAHRWAQLNELIGAADGKKFRNYAQRLTLDVLLAYANQHLAALARRYRLERVRSSLALLVVDQDMADEVRSVHSLSGGESFLVSLALALGLASLSSHRVRVESLFIDEGFGSLDADTLRVAMDALDSLQSQGRKVGVISHVQEMTERIGTCIHVRRLASGRSAVRIVGAAR